MWFDALLPLVGLLVLFAGGRLVLAFLPPGWPGWAPGMGRRELGATIGASGLLGLVLVQVCSTMAFLVGMAREDLGDVNLQFWTLFSVYFAVIAVLALAALLRAPAKLRPRHEYTRPRTRWFVWLLAALVTVASAWPAFRTYSASLSERPESIAYQLSLFWKVSLLWGSVTDLCVVLLLAGALGQLRRANWMPWVVAGCVLACLQLSEVEHAAKQLYGMQSSRLAASLSLALAVALVWNRRADRRALTLAYLLLASMPILDKSDTPVAATGILLITIFLPGKARVSWPWIVLLVSVAARLSSEIAGTRQLDMPFGISIPYPVLTLGDLYLRGPLPVAFVALASVLWLASPWAKRRDEAAGLVPVPAEKRVLTAHILATPVALLLATWFRGTSFINWEDSFFGGFSGASMDLRDFLLGWMPSMLLLAGLTFAPPVIPRSVPAPEKQ